MTFMLRSAYLAAIAGIPLALSARAQEVPRVTMRTPRLLSRCSPISTRVSAGRTRTATAMTFAENGDFAELFGIQVHGRDAIEQRFTALFKGNLRGTNRTDTVRNVHFYAADVAFVDADTVITGTKRADGSWDRCVKG